MKTPIPENPTTAPLRNLRVLTLISAISTLILAVPKLFSSRVWLSEGVEFLVSVVFAIGFLTIPYWFVWFLLKKISQRKNWARITYLILLLIGLAMSVPDWLKNSGWSILSTLFGIALGYLNVKHTLSLFSEASNVWFESSDEPSPMKKDPPVD